MHTRVHSVDAACELLGGISRSTFYRLVREGQLRTAKVGGRRFVSDEAIREWIARAEGRVA